MGQVNMKNKILRTLLTLTILAACMPSTTTTIPSAIPPTSTSTVMPTSTRNIPATQVAATQIAALLQPYQNLLSDDLSPLHRTLGEELIKTLWYTENAIWWSSSDKEIAQNLLKLGLNPGLGVRELHAQGITGKGITAAIIDQPMILDHPEFQGKVIKYRDMGTNQPAGAVSLHGPAVTSLLAGNNIGTAPDAKIYYAAVPSWLLDAQYYADALDWVIAENQRLPKDDKIRVVSVSSIVSGIWSEYQNQDAWEAAYQRATEAGILVLDCTYEHGYTVPCTYDLYDPDNVAKCIPNWSGPTDSPHRRINIPMSHRSVALERKDKPVFTYQYDGPGGISWTVPYLSGVLAMGWQINPELTGEQLLDMIFASAYKTGGPADIIDPKVFIDMVSDTIEK
jgi:hypothetical protein